MRLGFFTCGTRAVVARVSPFSVLASMALLAVLDGCAPRRGTIGALLGRRPSGELTVREVPRGLGSARAGLAPGDRILLVDGIDVRLLSSDELREVLAGLPGESVRLTVLRGDAIVRVDVRRTPAPEPVHEDQVETP